MHKQEINLGWKLESVWWVRRRDGKPGIKIAALASKHRQEAGGRVTVNLIGAQPTAV